MKRKGKTCALLGAWEAWDHERGPMWVLPVRRLMPSCDRDLWHWSAWPFLAKSLPSYRLVRMSDG